MREEYEYDAFISYSGSRGSNGASPTLDRVVAERLHKALEAYRVPRALVKDSTRVPPVPSRLKKVFRDTEELHASSNLSQSLIDALQRSRFLIVVCSPRAKKSEWIQREIAAFRQLGRGDRILPILIEGDPLDAFPSALLKSEDTHRQPEFPGGENDALLAQPLAADIRASSRAKSLQLLKQERLRLLAPILGCSYDDLRQREQERFLRRVVLSAAILFMVSASLAILSVLLFLARQQAARNAAVADANARIAGENERKARISQREAERYAEEAQKNEREAIRNADLAKQNELAARRNQAKAEKNYSLALDAFSRILPLATRPEDTPKMKRVYLSNTIRELEALRKYDSENLKSLTILRALYGSLASEMRKDRDPEAAAMFAKARSFSIPESRARLRLLERSIAATRGSNALDDFFHPNEYDLNRFKDQLSTFKGMDADLIRLKDAEELLEIVAQYLLQLDLQTQEGKREASRVLRMNIDWFHNAAKREPLSKVQQELLALMNGILQQLLTGK